MENSSKSSCYIWPRQEVLYLVLPQLSSCGRILSTSLILSSLKQLSKMQNSDGIIRYVKYAFLVYTHQHI